MGTAWGPREDPAGTHGDPMGTHGDTTRTHGGGMGAQSYDTLVFAIDYFRIGRTKLTSIYSYKLHFVLNVRCQILAPRPQNPV